MNQKKTYVYNEHALQLSEERKLRAKMKKVDFSDVAVEQSPPEARRVDRVVGSVLGVVALIYATALFNVVRA